MKFIYLSILIMTSFLATGQELSFFDKLDKFNINLALPVEHSNNQFNSRTDEFAQYDAIIRPENCHCEIRYIIQDNYVPGPFLPPHAEMIRLLGSLGSNGTNNILIEQFPEESGQWSATAHFAPKIELTSFDFATISSYYKTNGPLIHVIVFYNGDKRDIMTYLDGNRY